MLFSILIANYNNGHFFEDCYNSIIEQTFQKFEVIIVDDASTDDSVEVIKKIISKDTRFKLFINSTNQKVGFTKNKCVQNSNGEICAFLDPDDTLEKNALEVMIKAHETTPNASLISSKHYLVDLNLNKIKIDTQGKKIPSNKSYLTFEKGAITHFASFKKEHYNKTDGINSKFKRAADQDLYYKLEEVGETSFINIPLYNYRINKNSISANKNTFKAEYWHFIAIEDAYLRRNIDNLELYSLKKLNKIRYQYFKERMQYETEKGKILNKYYFLKKIIAIKPFKQPFYKIGCLLIPNFS